MMRESQIGEGKGPNGTDFSDPMQVNNFGDWTKDKARIGLIYNVSIPINMVVRKAILWLYLKGMGSTTNGKMSWNDKNGKWKDAVKYYNGHPNKKHRENYVKQVYEYYNNTIKPKSQYYGY